MDSFEENYFLNLNKSINLFELYELSKDKELTIKFLQSRGLLKSSMFCPMCKWEMRRCGDFWKCCKYRRTKQGKKKCQKKISLKKGTLFDKTKLSFDKVLLVNYMLVKNYQQILIADELKLSQNTVSQWSIFLKQVFVDWFETQLKPLGGPGKTVEVDESVFGKTKYHRGHAVDGQWVFGAIERESKKIVLVPIEDRSSQTLTELIKKWILPQTTIISDCWKDSKTLDKEGHEHLTVNHSITFVNKETSAHTNSIESIWRHAKVFLPSYNRKKNFMGYLAHFCMKYKAKQEKIDLFNIVLEHISQLSFDHIDSLEKNDSENESELVESKIFKKRKKE